jgi:hypothetical protein
VDARKGEKSMNSKLTKIKIEEEFKVNGKYLIEKGDEIFVLLDEALLTEGTKPSGFSNIIISFSKEIGGVVQNGGRFIENKPQQILQWEDGSGHSKTTDYNGYWQIDGKTLKLMLKNSADMYDLKYFQTLVANSLGTKYPVSIEGLDANSAKTMAMNMSKMGMGGKEIYGKLIDKGFPVGVVKQLFAPVSKK